MAGYECRFPASAAPTGHLRTGERIDFFRLGHRRTSQVEAVVPPQRTATEIRNADIISAPALFHKRCGSKGTFPLLKRPLAPGRYAAVFRTIRAVSPVY